LTITLVVIEQAQVLYGYMHYDLRLMIEFRLFCDNHLHIIHL